MTLVFRRDAGYLVRCSYEEKQGGDVLHQSGFIIDLNKSFQIGKIGMEERGCDFITFGLNVRLKLCW